MLDESDFLVGSCGIVDYAAVTRCGLAFAYGMPMGRVEAPVSRWLGRVFDREEVRDTAPRVVADWLKRWAPDGQ